MTASEDRERGPSEAAGAREETVTLPEMGEESIERVERAVFDAIAQERHHAVRRGRRRRRVWGGVAIAACLVVVAAVAVPSLLVRSTSMSDVAGSPESMPVAPVPGGIEMQVDDGGAEEASSGSAPDQAPGSDGALEDDREVAVTAEVSVRVASPSRAGERLGELAAEHGGYVQDLRVSATDDAPAASEPAWYSDAATLRVPSDRLDAAIADLGELGKVLRTSISREDVTGHALDLRARVAAAEASIERLTELMTEAGDVADLLAAEEQLSQRQSELEAYMSELEHVEGRVAMSTLHVSLVREDRPAAVEPGSPFVDGLLTGWNALVAAFGGLVVAVGFALPWLVPVGLIVLIVWLIRRRRRRGDDAPETI